jgi:hypothetical protein
MPQTDTLPKLRWFTRETAALVLIDPCASIATQRQTQKKL